MKLNLVQVCDAGLVALFTAGAAALAGWPLALAALIVGLIFLRRASKAPDEGPEEAAEGRQRTYAQFQKDLHDPTGTPAVSIFRDLN
ncbi:MAG: hypothetical protein ACT4QA_23175 [Panacagrimonas sp.]